MSNFSWPVGTINKCNFALNFKIFLMKYGGLKKYPKS